LKSNFGFELASIGFGGLLANFLFLTLQGELYGLNGGSRRG
jgi:hypothetical protein